ncbi:hypothetical protein, partial [Rickettsiales endosymbiont of Peranema trichophorum]|uniref:hypothetical protein n=1 Tax=Rickettsiales endosymbiont of Peranema trichophorum TaxID=2486577 RepID=UPI001A9229C0
QHTKHSKESHTGDILQKGEMVAEYNEIARRNVYENTESIFHLSKAIAAKERGEEAPISFGAGDLRNLAPSNGHRVQSRLRALNAIASALSTKPYTSVTEVDGHTGSPLCVVLGDPDGALENPDTRIRRGEDGVPNVFNALKNFVAEPKDDKKYELFKEMVSNKNCRCIATAGIVYEEIKKYLRLLGKKRPELNEDKLSEPKAVELEIGEQEEFRGLDSKYSGLGLNDDKLNKLRVWVESLEGVGIPDINEHADVGALIVDQMFSQWDLDALRDHRDLLDKKVKLLSEVEEGYIPKHGIHVDLKAIPYMRKEHPVATTFNVGIANANPRHPSFCCACCTAEREVLERQGIIVNVSAISFEHFPKGFYAPSANVASDNELLEKFISTIHSRAEYKLIGVQENSPLYNRLQALGVEVARVGSLLPIQSQRTQVSARSLYEALETLQQAVRRVEGISWLVVGSWQSKLESIKAQLRQVKKVGEVAKVQKITARDLKMLHIGLKQCKTYITLGRLLCEVMEIERASSDIPQEKLDGIKVRLKKVAGTQKDVLVYQKIEEKISIMESLTKVRGPSSSTPTPGVRNDGPEVDMDMLKKSIESTRSLQDMTQDPGVRNLNDDTTSSHQEIMGEPDPIKNIEIRIDELLKQQTKDGKKGKGWSAEKILREADSILQELGQLKIQSQDVKEREATVRDFILQVQNNQKMVQTSGREEETVVPKNMQPVEYGNSVEGSQDHDRLVPSRASSLYTTENI